MKVEKVEELESGELEVFFSDVTEEEFTLMVNEGRKIKANCTDEECFSLAMQEALRELIKKEELKQSS